MRSKKVIMAAGGTGGHLFPAQALADELLKLHPEIDVLFAGANLSANTYFNKSQFAHRDIVSATPFTGGLPKMLKASSVILKGIWKSLDLLSQEKPDLIIGFGSFHTFPILCAAILKKIPLVLFESNAIPGKVVRLFSKKAKVCGIHFPEAEKYIKGNVLRVDIPTAAKKVFSKVEACNYFNLDPELLTLLVFGGSQGAKRINQILSETLLLLKGRAFQLLHFTGCDKTAAQIIELCENLDIRCCTKKFEPQMPYAWSAADIVICRSGAITLSELLRYEVPGILIPFPFAADQHQLRNAECLVRSGGAICLAEKDLTAELLSEALIPFLSGNSVKRLEMQKAMQAYKASQQKADFVKVISEYL